MKVNKVMKARKAIPESGIAKGDTYYWWAFRYGGKRVSKTYPRASQLTQNEYLGTLYSTQESLDDEVIKLKKGEKGEIDKNELVEAIRSASSEMESAAEGCEDKASNLEEGFPNGCPGIDMQNERAEAARQLAQELEELADTIEDEKQGEKETDETFRERLAVMVETIEWSSADIS